MPQLSTQCNEYMLITFLVRYLYHRRRLAMNEAGVVDRRQNYCKILGKFVHRKLVRYWYWYGMQIKFFRQCRFCFINTSLGWTPMLFQLPFDYTTQYEHIQHTLKKTDT